VLNEIGLAEKILINAGKENSMGKETFKLILDNCLLRHLNCEMGIGEDDSRKYLENKKVGIPGYIFEKSNWADVVLMFSLRTGRWKKYEKLLFVLPEQI
jgi:hypothetical protein